MTSVKSDAASDTAARLQEASTLSSLIICVAEQAKRSFAETAAAHGLTAPLARAVLQLGSPEPMRDLAEVLDCDRSYVTNLADQLEERGLLTRVAGTDRRIKLLALTDAGARVREELSAAVAQRALVLSRLSKDERAALVPLLEKLAGDDAESAHC